jgi:hypothetical protein
VLKRPPEPKASPQPTNRNCIGRVLSESLFDAFSSHEPVSTSLENALAGQ